MRRLIAWGDEVQGLRAFLEARGGEAELVVRGGRALVVLPHDQAAEALARELGLSCRVEAGGRRWEIVAIGDPAALGLEGARVVSARRRGELRRLRVEGSLDSRALLERAHEAGVDLCVRPQRPHLRAPRLVVLDMDSTLISIEVVDELARACGRYEEVARITARAMRGELDFEQSLRARVALLAGQAVEVVERLAEALPLQRGAERLVAGLRALGIRTAVLSGGFTQGVEAIRARLGLDHAHANHLEAREGRLTGRLVGPIVDAARKAALLEAIAREEGADPRQVVAVGDGANDRLMLEKAGLGVAFHAKPALRQVADAVVARGGLDVVLAFLGWDEEAMEELLGG